MWHAEPVLSKWASQDWGAFTAVLAGGDRAAAQAALQSFLLGVAYRGEELSAHELSELLDRAELTGEARADLAEAVEFALGLLVAYGKLFGDEEDGGEGEGEEGFESATGGREPGIGELVI